MTFRATLTLADQTTRYRDFESELDARAWVESVGESKTYGEPSEYLADVQDVTAEVAQQDADRAAIARGRAKQDVGADAVAMLNQVHEEMKLDAQGLAALAADQTLMLAVTLVRNGALATGRDIFLAVAKAHYTDAQIARIVKPINDSGLAV